MWRGTIPTALLVAALALFVAAYDAAEPTAQEVDHPTRWESYPDQPGRLLLQHLAASFIVMVLVCLVAGGDGAGPRALRGRADVSPVC